MKNAYYEDGIFRDWYGRFCVKLEELPENDMGDIYTEYYIYEFDGQNVEVCLCQ